MKSFLVANVMCMFIRENFVNAKKKAQRQSIKVTVNIFNEGLSGLSLHRRTQAPAHLPARLPPIPIPATMASFQLPEYVKLFPALGEAAGALLLTKKLVLEKSGSFSCCRSQQNSI